MPFAFAFHLHLILILSLADVLKPFYCHNSKIPNTVNNDLSIRILTIFLMHLENRNIESYIMMIIVLSSK